MDFEFRFHMITLHVDWNISRVIVIIVPVIDFTPSLGWKILTPYSVQMWENADQNNFEYVHLLRSVNIT